mgnify:CR=1 FL=1
MTSMAELIHQIGIHNYEVGQLRDALQGLCTQAAYIYIVRPDSEGETSV